MTTDQDPRTREVLAWLREDGHENAERVLLAALDEVDTTRQRRSWLGPAWRTGRPAVPARLVAIAVAVLVIAAVGYPLLAGSNSQPPSPVLIAKGSLVEHDWGVVELEATRLGSTVTGRMAIGKARGDGWPLTVDLQCARTTDDGVVLLGGRLRTGGAMAVDPRSPLAGIALKPGTPVRALVWVGGPLDLPGTWTTDCLAYLDAQLNHARRVSGGVNWIPNARDGVGTVEFGP